MRTKVNEIGGLGNNTVPNGYNQPNFGMATAMQVGPCPDQQMVAQSAADTPNGSDLINKGFQIGGANDPLSEFEKSENNPPEWSIGGGKPTAPMNAPSHPVMNSMKETGIGMNPDGTPVGIIEDDNPFAEDDELLDEDDDFLDEDDSLSFEDVDALPAFEDIEDDPSMADLPVDANGVIDPIVVPDEVNIEPELGSIPDVVLPLEEPILEIGEDDVDIQVPENVFETDGVPEAIFVTESFKLPENQRVVVGRGDQIFFLGHVREDFIPKFAETVFTRALKSLYESKSRYGRLTMSGSKNEKVAIVGRSMLVEVAKDWRLPGTSTIFEAHDLLQIVSSKPIHESNEIDEDENSKKADDDKTKEEAEEEKLKKEAYLAYRRWKRVSETHKKKEDDDSFDEDDDSDDDDEIKSEKKKRREKARREAEFISRQRNGGYI
jgi:hypothetical protein